MNNVEFNQDGIGGRIQLYQRVKNQLDKRSGATHDLRMDIGDKIVRVTPDWSNPNIAPGTAVGAIVAAITIVADEYIPIGADTEIVDIDEGPEGTVYTVNVDSPLPQQAVFQGQMEAGGGFQSFITDEFDVREQRSVNDRLIRDTWQIEVEVIDSEPTDTKDRLGFGILQRLAE